MEWKTFKNHFERRFQNFGWSGSCRLWQYYQTWLDCLCINGKDWPDGKYSCYQHCTRSGRACPRLDCASQRRWYQFNSQHQYPWRRSSHLCDWRGYPLCCRLPKFKSGWYWGNVNIEGRLGNGSLRFTGYQRYYSGDYQAWKGRQAHCWIRFQHEFFTAIYLAGKNGVLWPCCLCQHCPCQWWCRTYVQWRSVGGFSHR